MRREDLVALALDAERVRDALATLKWWLRGVVVGAGSASQEAVAESALNIAERAESTANVLAVELCRERDAEGGGES